MPRRILFESLLESTVSGGSTQHFVEAARLALSRQICAHIADENRIISGYVIEPELEVALQQSLIDAGEEKRLVASPDVTSRLVESIRGITKDVEHGVSQPIILTNSELRASLSDFARQHNIEVQILSFMEISREFVFHPIGTLGGVTNPVNDNMPEAA